MTRSFQEKKTIYTAYRKRERDEKKKKKRLYGMKGMFDRKRQQSRIMKIWNVSDVTEQNN